MNNSVKNTGLENKIFTAVGQDFTTLSLEIFQFQYEHNDLYQQYCKLLKRNPANVTSIEEIPFLPIGFFKTFSIQTTPFVPEAIFESSGTTQTINSRHLVRDISIYKQSFTKCFELFYGDPKKWCIIALLPSYLERKNSSLVMMAYHLMKASMHPDCSFYLNETAELNHTLLKLEKEHQKTLLLGVTFALLDFAEEFPERLKHTIIMETGGMKGRRKEMTREEVHTILCKKFHLHEIHSEYGMTELLSQAYSKGNGKFHCPPWMKILIRDEDDPMTIHSSTNSHISGVINVIDLANIYSCSFIATDDAGKLYADNSFEVLGRVDNTDVRGCSLLAV